MTIATTVAGLLLVSPPQHDVVLSLLPDAPQIRAARVAGRASAAEHVAALEKAAGHGESFWVGRVAGDGNAKRVVFVVPQYHRDDTTPVSWTTLGREIAVVQQHIDTLVRTLALSHGVSCVGSEGSSVGEIRYSAELRQLGEWKQSLARNRRAMLQELGADAERARQPADTILRVLGAAIRIHAAYQDGVGAAQARLEGRVKLTRFGLENAEANQEALGLLGELRAIERRLARLEPESDPVEVGILGSMWLDEYPAYEAGTLRPLSEALGDLDALRLELYTDGARQLARVVGGFVARARRVATAAIRPDEVEANIAYYREVERRAKQQERTGRALSQVEKGERKRLLARQADVTARFETVTMKHREHVAVQHLFDRMQAGSFDRCILVMGAGHEDALVALLLAKNRERRLGPLGVVVVVPFEPEE